jgi:hypothetical protein
VSLHVPDLYIGGKSYDSLLDRTAAIWMVGGSKQPESFLDALGRRYKLPNCYIGESLQVKQKNFLLLYYDFEVNGPRYAPRKVGTLRRPSPSFLYAIPYK